jgi:alpha-L-rhamnosidase
METPGWTSPGFNAAGWSTVLAANSSGGILASQMIPPITVQDILLPKTITQPQSGVYVYDFEQSTRSITFY